MTPLQETFFNGNSGMLLVRPQYHVYYFKLTSNKVLRINLDSWATGDLNYQFMSNYKFKNLPLGQEPDDYLI